MVYLKRKTVYRMFVLVLVLSIIIVFKNAGAVQFPENHITLMKVWVQSKDLSSSMTELQTLLSLLPPTADLKNVDNDPSKFPNKISNEWKNYMKKLLDTSDNTLLTQKRRKALLDLLGEMKTLYEGYNYMQSEQYGLALGVFLKFPSQMKTWENIASGGAYVSVNTLQTYMNDAFSSNTLKYYKGVKVDWWDYPDAYSIEGTEYTIRGYKSSNISAKLKNFWTDWKSNRFGAFELQLLIAEVYHQLGDFRRAQQIYDLLMQNLVNGKGYYNYITLKWESVSEAEKKLIRIRSAFNQIAWGDQYFKRARGLPDCDRAKQLKLAYDKYWYAKQDLGTLCTNIKVKKTAGSLSTSSTGQTSGNKTWQMANPIPKDHAVLYDAMIKDFAVVQADKFEVIGDSKKKGYQQVVQIKDVIQWSDPVIFDALVDVLKLDFTTSTMSDIVQPIVSTECAKPAHNPLIVEACLTADMQMYKINNKLNYLGYPEDYIPDQRYKFLYNLAKEYADLAISAENRYIQFKKEAENLEYMNRQLGQNAQLAVYQQQIANTRKSMASLKVAQSEWRIQAIDKRIDALQSANWTNWIGTIFKGISAGATAYFSSGTSLLSFGAELAGQYASSIMTDGEVAALYLQQKAEKLNKEIAMKEEYIADLEINITQMQAIFLRDNLNFLASKEMNQELHYKLASMMKRIKKGYLDAGIRMGFLAERSLAFETGRMDLEFIKFDYELSVLKGLLAGDFLKQDLVMMENDRALSLKQRNHVKHIISLKENYPYEFVKFLETGRMDFATGLYEFDKAYPGTYQRRLRRVEVAIQGLVGPEGYKGKLLNFGSFAVRSKDKTMGTTPSSPGTVTLTVPKLMYGVDSYSLPFSQLVLSSYDIRKDQLIFPSEKEVREVFEGFGLSGLWRLELPYNLNDTDYRTISDIQLILYFDAYYNSGLEKMMAGYYDTVKKSWIKGLVEKYEEEKSGGNRLDRIAMFSMRQHFPDEFFSFTGGSVTFELIDGDFPFYTRDKRVKKVIVRAVGEKGDGVQGIGLTVNYTGSADIIVDGITNQDGFTPDPSITKELMSSSQVPAVGKWKIDLKSPEQAKKINDLIVFIEYYYTEKKYIPGT